ncbi:helix-turn-helix domain-containing protein [Paradevosia shaoguanensis]|uniref:Helix-turn-helix domain-containing protein n=1 Tax=Paradevosia shaoguanensis TaxID=1335043 RepID=A0AA41QT29_9HYPH|nr:helix-turn-helix domain-containing protein [Paradevosia shaoguanensis]MCF1744658.1 helix-turn-helix domain-containing protein [Paradevosia shaoguanensis]MCI0129141.1 helix-turn-helix domain-containing protein [Paradevosia shaoguanensis]
MNRPKVWDRHAIKAEVHRRGMTLTGIAKDAGLDQAACRHGLLGSHRKGAEAIAAALKLPFRELFPDSYTRGAHNERQTSRKASARDSSNARSRADSAQGVA